MLVVTNTIRIKAGFGKQVAERFANAKGVQQMPGFVRMEAWLGEGKEGEEELKVCTLWENEEAFHNWTSSETFRASHRGAGDSKEYMLGASLNKYELVVSHNTPQGAVSE
ncbi:antibiotic biosynthesis monooxygenase [Paenibacillus apiarius]|uniref:Antibiotic biosynthesis monooxygenase n=1 Tax=Paenibacillus apiarius TaxID=46240 RepID=A0ABT4DMJ2_9BACL|nr:antibiotic biosynthesis monooxygenase [Paenibacillus apiarius]MBN3522593.1 antibiotic biosynthesis monooxygenase [Paenibacillus apiarius]MCY9514559.1 antibiotic biosynthesis monooxygenase [Paenibacillus apiarius]MCY9518549.1 antibiotic biosynthesis monooxygenase [Paenibacillus apiarius]MCY9552637.1 antibiotic biosynthesis monooxygenase [Paenibacillus apiarius]MCY9557035.1 antibiotic biosynthesis monooxygenase [Paenibacillus apiarius]